MSNHTHTSAEFFTTLKKVNATQVTTDLASWLNTERGVIVQVEVLVVLSVVLHAVLVVCGWWRRCSSNSWIKYSLWLAYTANSSLVLYTLGLMGAASFKSSLFTVFSFGLVLVLGGTNLMTAYSIDDNKHYTRHFIQQCLYVLSLLSVLNINVTNITSFRSLWVIIAFCLYFLTISINPGRIYASMIASSFLDENTVNVAKHMERSHAQSTSYDPVTLEGYDYLVHDDITVSQIWASHEGVLGSSDGKQLKEVCLSFALFRLLRRRLFGIPCPESKLQKTRDFVMNGLLSDVENDNCDAAYRVIAAELAFTHDHFFTSSASVNDGKEQLIIRLGIMKVALYLSCGLLWVLDLDGKSGERSKVFSSTPKVTARQTLCDKILAAVIITVFSSLDLLQLYLYFSSDWTKVELVRYSMSGQGAPIFLRRCYCRLRLIFGYWQNKVGQHSLLKDLHGRSFIYDIIGSLSGCYFGFLFSHRSAIPRGISNPGIKGPNHTELTGDVKLTVARTLKASNGQLSNGAISLRRNAQIGLLWACQQENNDISTLLIWHVATEYCDIAAQSSGQGEQGNSDSNRKVACTLSSYCAYLMAYVPELLPGHELVTRELFYKVRQDALNILSRRWELSEKYTALEELAVQPSNESIFKKGICLGKQLKEIGHDMHWKILADFWAEMILYIAPSDNAKAHFEHLANGGEFLTHLWALLFHAGIVERGELNIDEENAGDLRLQHPSGNNVEPPEISDVHQRTANTGTQGFGNGQINGPGSP